ncbi:MAG: glycerophosphoryl diester phosphodiesterase [Gaiellales bacterium]|jgi:glycerophosphoryl diester phosphodiesterase|nr:glycerophosphoryl diester phosphodiesterase [Gaiellales bacterium]
MDGGPIICAHRGASAFLTDNSVEAFETAIAMGAEMLEGDVRHDAAGRLVLAHDPVPVEPHEAPVPLADLIALAAGRATLDIELKEAGCETDLLALLAARREGVTVTSFLPEVVAKVKSLDPGLRTGLIIGDVAHGRDLFARAADCGADVLVAHIAMLDRRLRRHAQKRDTALWVWTVNDRRRLSYLVADPLIECIITDVPDLALELRDRRAA